MNSRQVECVLEVAKTLNFNRAANNLYISQPTLSHHIKTLENEVGFKIFDRTNHRVTMTAVGQQFCNSLSGIATDLQATIERCQNFNSKYSKNISISLFVRTALKNLPRTISDFSKKYPDIFIDTIFDDTPNRIAHFLEGESDIFFSRGGELNNVSGINFYPIYDSQLKLVVRANDPLADVDLVKPRDLVDRTLLVGGGSPPALKSLQRELSQEFGLRTMNSHDHSTTLTYVAAEGAVCLSPDVYEDNDPAYKWLNFDSGVTIPCYLCTHDDASKAVIDFVQMLRHSYL